MTIAVGILSAFVGVAMIFTFINTGVQYFRGRNNESR